MDGHRARIVSVAILTGGGLVGGWQRTAMADLGTYADSPAVGINIAGLANQSTQWTLTDLYLSSGEWDNDSSNGATAPNTSADWPSVSQPGQAVGSNIVLNNFANYPTGPSATYTVTWQGAGALSLGTGFWESDPASSNTTMTETFTTSPGSSSLYLYQPYESNLAYANSTDPIHNVHIYMPGYGPTSSNPNAVFTSQFEQGIKPFGTIRFMDAMNTNGNTAVMNSTSSSTNPPPPGPQITDPKWNTSAGMPVAAMVQLANETNTNPWFNIPANATPAYITQFANYVKSNLNPNLKVYVEYGNEDWSGNNPANATIAANAGGAIEGTAFDAAWANQVQSVFQDWEKVYTGSASGTSSSLVRVAAFQTSNRYDTPMFLTDLKGNGGFDAVADAPYFSPDTSTYNASTTSTQILNDLLANIVANANTTPNGQKLFSNSNIIQATGDWAWNKQLANFFGVPLIGYEGGQGLAPGSTSVSWYNAYVAAEQSPEMEQIYYQWLQTYLQEVGGSEVNQFDDVSPIGAYGAYGIQEYQDQTIGSAQGDATKYQGILDYLDATPEPTTLSLLVPAGCLLLARRRREDSAAPSAPQRTMPFRSKN